MQYPKDHESGYNKDPQGFLRILKVNAVSLRISLRILENP
jgi:hypothetical protein